MVECSPFKIGALLRLGSFGGCMNRRGPRHGRWTIDTGSKPLSVTGLRGCGHVAGRLLAVGERGVEGTADRRGREDPRVEEGGYQRDHLRSTRRARGQGSWHHRPKSELLITLVPLRPQISDVRRSQL